MIDHLYLTDIVVRVGYTDKNVGSEVFGHPELNERRESNTRN
ncbi:MAG: hypothetical protein WAM94_03290 [Chromatiaceae bacterium]